MVSFWLSNENYSKLFADERRTRNTSIQHASVEPVEPSNCGQAILFDTTNLKPQEMHERLHAVLGSVLQSGFIKWSDNMCHFDAPFAVKLACLVAVGPGYWKTPIGTERRALSRTEQWDVDLLCSVQTNTEEQVQHLRNMYNQCGTSCHHLADMVSRLTQCNTQQCAVMTTRMAGTRCNQRTSESRQPCATVHRKTSRPMT